jgi:hypothetical protein
MGLGGPVWHASAAPLPGAIYLPARLRRLALEALDGVGDARLGEWWEDTGGAVHCRRRLSIEEQQSVGPVVDIRGTQEVAARLAPLRAHLPSGWSE